MKPTRTPLALFATVLFAVSLPPGVAGADDGWVQDANEKGVVVTTKTEPGRSLPIFRGVGTVDANVFEILAVLDDIGHFTEWMADCKAARVVKQVSELERFEYNRIGAPWPVSDRDTVIRSWVQGSVSKRDVWARFQSVSRSEAPPVGASCACRAWPATTTSR